MQNLDKAANDNNIEKNLFFMDETGNIVNYLLNPPNLIETKENMFKMVASMASNKMLQA